MSGTALHHWAFSTLNQARSRTENLARRVASSTDQEVDMSSPADVLRLLRSVDARFLVEPDNFYLNQTEVNEGPDSYYNCRYSTRGFP